MAEAEWVAVGTRMDVAAILKASTGSIISAVVMCGSSRLLCIGNCWDVDGDEEEQLNVDIAVDVEVE